MGRTSPLGIEGTGVTYRDADARGRMTVAMTRARDERGVYQTKRFPVLSWHRDGSPVLPDAALAWARETRHDFIRGVAVAGACDFQHFAGVLQDNLRAAGVTEGRLAFIANVAAGLRSESIGDMKADNFCARVRQWINGLTACWSMAADAPNRRKGVARLSPATRNKVLTVCRQVTGLAVKKRRLPFDPLAELPRFKESEYIKPLFSVTELRHMVSDSARDRMVSERQALEAAIGSPKKGNRAKAIKSLAKRRGCHWTSLYNALARPSEPDPWWLACCMVVFTGCRVQEAMHLRWEWIRWNERQITLKLTDDYEQKSDSERLIPLEPELAEILRPIAKTHGHILPGPIRAGGSGMRARGKATLGEGSRDYSGAMRNYLKRIGVDPEDRTCHSLRHCYITLKLARDDTNIEKLMKAVGHRDLSTTMGYGRQSQFYEAEVDLWPDRTLWLRRPVPKEARGAIVV